MSGDARSLDRARGWLVAGALGGLAGYAVGAGATGAYADARWPALAGLVLGVVASLGAPTRRVLVASFAGGVAVAVAVAVIVSARYRSGDWPITDELAIAQYGTAAQATLRAAALLGVGLGVPCLMAAALVAAVGRRRGSDLSRPRS